MSKRTKIKRSILSKVQKYCLLVCFLLMACGEEPSTSSTSSSSSTQNKNCTSTDGSIYINGPSKIVKSISSTETVIELLDVGGYSIPSAGLTGSLYINTLSTSGSLSMQTYYLHVSGNCSSSAAILNASDRRYSMSGGGNDITREFIVLKNTTTDPLNIILCTSTSKSTNCNNSIMAIYGVIKDEQKVPVNNAYVSIASNGFLYKATSDSNGSYLLTLDKTVMDNLSEAFAVSAYESTGHHPYTYTNIKSTSTTRYPNDVVLPTISGSPRLISVELVPYVHHLGDSNYGGSINSQFQYPGAEGTYFASYFGVSSAQKSYAYTTLKFYAKGVQGECADEVWINNTKIGTLSSSYSTGAYSYYSISINPTILTVGSYNTFQIKSQKSSSTDYDDFEFTNAQIYFN